MRAADRYRTRLGQLFRTAKEREAKETHHQDDPTGSAENGPSGSTFLKSPVFLERLAGLTRLIMFDKRGTGMSDRTR